MRSGTECFIKGGDFVTRHIAGQILIVPVRTHVADLDSIYTLSEVGTMIWNLIDGQISVNQIVEALCREYDVTPEDAAKDAIEFLDSLEAAGLIHPCLESEG